MTSQGAPLASVSRTDQTPFGAIVPLPLYVPKPVVHERETPLEPWILPVQLIPKLQAAVKPH